MKTKGKILSLMLSSAMILGLFTTGALAVMDDDHDRISVAAGEYAELEWRSDSPSDPDYFKADIVANSSGYYPAGMVFYVDSGTISGSVTATPLYTSGGGTAYNLELPSSSGSFTVTLSAPAESPGVYTIYYSAPSGTAPTPGAEIYAFLPAPGQFTNEGVTTGGWGDAYTSGGVLKANSATGMSLGFFGGYVVYKFDSPVANSSSNPFGADFIVYGNAFWANSEPGCIQVSADGSTWFDIAGSSYYDDDSVKEYAITYTNPTPADDTIPTAANNLGTRVDVPYTDNQSGSGAVVANSYHNHSYFPLWCNYFAGRYGNPALDKVSSLPFASYTLDAVSGSELTLSGVKLGGISSTATTAALAFGYCDVHPNKTLGGSLAYNPYLSDLVTSSSAWNTFVNSGAYTAAAAAGGDPIDISWAVNADGEPVSLPNIQYVRIYTGTAKMNGVFGEISTEATGVAACSGTGGGAATSDLNIWDAFTESVETETANMAAEPVSAGSYVLYSDEDNVFVNGVRQDGSSGYEFTVSSGSVVQIITQSGTESPYITVLVCS